MTAINGFQSVSAIGSSAGFGAGSDAAVAARAAVNEIGQRVGAWVQALAPGGRAGSVDQGTLARGGDVYGLRQIADDLSGRFGATPTQAGALSRALEGVARGAAVEAVLLHGSAAASGPGLSAALDASASAEVQGGGIDEVTARLDQAAVAFEARIG